MLVPCLPCIWGMGPILMVFSALGSPALPQTHVPGPACGWGVGTAPPTTAGQNPAPAPCLQGGCSRGLHPGPKGQSTLNSGAHRGSVTPKPTQRAWATGWGRMGRFPNLGARPAPPRPALSGLRPAACLLLSQGGLRSQVPRGPERAGEAGRASGVSGRQAHQGALLSRGRGLAAGLSSQGRGRAGRAWGFVLVPTLP